MVDAKLDKDNEVVVDNAIVALRPRSHSRVAAALVGVAATGIKLAVAVLDGVDVAVRKLGALVCEAVLVGQALLERRRVDLVRHGLVVDGVAHGAVLDLECTVLVRIQVVAARVRDDGFFGVVPWMRVSEIAVKREKG